MYFSYDSTVYDNFSITDQRNAGMTFKRDSRSLISITMLTIDRVFTATVLCSLLADVVKVRDDYICV